MKEYSYGGMLPDDIIKLLRVQKHDFLNHFQVILGYLQLEKYENALEYTKNAINITQENGSIMKLNTNLSFLFMNLLLKIQMIGVEPKIKISTLLDKINNKEEDNLCKIIDNLWKTITAQLLRCSTDERYLEINIHEVEENYIFSFKFSYNENTIFYKEIEEISNYVSFCDFNIETKDEDELFCINLWR